MQVRIEDLVGVMVRDADGRAVGRIEELRAMPDGNGLVITHYLLGPTGWLARLSLRGLRLGLGRRPGRRRSVLRRVPWDMLDLSDPRRPRLRLRARDAADEPAARRPPRRPRRAR